MDGLLDLLPEPVYEGDDCASPDWWLRLGEGNGMKEGAVNNSDHTNPLEMRYTGLDKNARYRLRVVYAGRFRAAMRLEANAGVAVHGPLRGAIPPQIQEFPLPETLTCDGELTLRWICVEGRGCQVAEAWLLPDTV